MFIDMGKEAFEDLSSLLVVVHIECLRVLEYHNVVFITVILTFISGSCRVEGFRRLHGRGGLFVVVSASRFSLYHLP